MFIRNIITTSALVVLLGLSGGSAYATDSDSHLDDKGFTVSATANYPGTVFVYNNDSDVNEDDIQSMDKYESSNVPDHISETLETN